MGNLFQSTLAAWLSLRRIALLVSNLLNQSWRSLSVCKWRICTFGPKKRFWSCTYQVPCRVLEWFEVAAWSLTLGLNKSWSSVYSSYCRMTLQPVECIVIHFCKHRSLSEKGLSLWVLFQSNQSMLSAHADAGSWKIITFFCVFLLLGCLSSGSSCQRPRDTEYGICPAWCRHRVVLHCWESLYEAFGRSGILAPPAAVNTDLLVDLMP